MIEQTTHSANLNNWLRSLDTTSLKLANLKLNKSTQSFDSQ